LAIEVPRATRVRALLAEGTEAAARQAAAEVADLLALYEARQDPLRVVELLGLQALTQEALGDSTAALDALGRALRLAEPAGRVRVFVDLGAAMHRQLTLYAVRRAASPYLERLVAACEATSAPRPPVAPRQNGAHLALVEPPT